LSNTVDAFETNRSGDMPSSRLSTSVGISNAFKFHIQSGLGHPMKRASKRQPVWRPLGESSLGFLLVHSAHGWVRSLEQALRPIGLTHLQFALMAAIALLETEGEIPHQGRLATFTGFDRIMVSKSLQLLLKKNFLKRAAHPSVPRANRIDLTRQGRAALDQARPLYDVAVEQYFGTLDSGRLATLGKALRALLDNHQSR
jgi:DNA-binding MarR family transcriptional regulator